MWIIDEVADLWDALSIEFVDGVISNRPIELLLELKQKYKDSCNNYDS